MAVSITRLSESSLRSSLSLTSEAALHFKVMNPCFDLSVEVVLEEENNRLHAREGRERPCPVLQYEGEAATSVAMSKASRMKIGVLELESSSSD